MMKLTENCVLIVVDIQEAFRTVIPDFEQIAKRSSIAVKGFQILGLPIIVTEQYPKGLGLTASEINSLLNDDFSFIEKNTFSSYGEPAFVEALQQLHASQVLVCGLETHICVNQTVLDLLNNNYDVHILSDCIASRNEIDKQTGIAKMIKNGANLSTVEMAFFEILKNSKHKNFRDIQKLIK